MTRHLVLGALAGLIFSGCAHQIVITPDVSKLDRSKVTQVDRSVGYVISAANRELEVTTPGGGGDKLRYKPYQELEPALFQVLSNLYRRAYRLESASDAETIQAKEITLVFVPQIKTQSSSKSPFTWPPTDFVVELEVQALDPAGTTLWTKRIVGEGKAEYSEFVSDMPLAARRASLSALSQLQEVLNTEPALR